MSLCRDLLVASSALVALANVPRADALSDTLTGDGLQNVEDRLNDALGNPQGSSSWIDLKTDPDPAVPGWLITERANPGHAPAGTYLLPGDVLIGTGIDRTGVIAMAGPWQENADFMTAVMVELLMHELTHCPPGDVPGGGGKTAEEPGGGSTCDHLETYQDDAARACGNAQEEKTNLVLLGSDLATCARWAAHCRFYKKIAEVANKPANKAKAGDCPDVDVDTDGNLVSPTCVWCEPLSQCSGMVGVGMPTDTEFGNRQGE